MTDDMEACVQMYTFPLILIIPTRSFVDEYMWFLAFDGDNECLWT